MSKTITLARELIRAQSVTPDDAGCMELINNELNPHNFIQQNFDKEEVVNRLFKHGNQPPHLCFLGHTDVVPTGDPSSWAIPPFAGVVRDDMLHGRGAADMKGSVAAFTIAAQRFVEQHPNHKGSLSILLTSDEEGPADHGIRYVAPLLANSDQPIDYCLVGEPSSTNKLGDIVKNGRRGSLGGSLKIIGKQGHVAYPHLADNPIHNALAALAELAATVWDNGNSSFPPTSFQISNINSGTGATNVIPADMDVIFNFRYCTEVTYQELQARTHEILDRYKLNYELTWKLNGEAFLTKEGALVTAVCDSIKETMGHETQLSTAGGTSDGRFIAPLGAEVVELGPLNKTIHQVNECVSVQDLEALEIIYYRIIEKVLL